MLAPMDLVVPILLWLIPSMLVTWLAIGKNLSAIGFALFAVICWPIALVVVLVMPRRPAAP